MAKWAKVDTKTNKIVEIVDSNEQPPAQQGFRYQQATGSQKVGDTAAAAGQ